MANREIPKVPIKRERFLEVLRARGSNVRKLGKAYNEIQRTEKTIRRCLDEGKMPQDLLERIARFLNVHPNYLAGINDEKADRIENICLHYRRHEMGEFKAFDWVKAAELIKEHKALQAYAGLVEEWEGTMAAIYCEKPIKDRHPYLASGWATPILALYMSDRNVIVTQCYKFVDDDGNREVFLKHAKTVWPEEALEILK